MVSGFHPRCWAICGAILCALPVSACDLLRFENAWIREPPPVSKVAAGYLSVNNDGDSDIKITDIEGTCCNHLMFHETITENGNSQMRHLNDLIVPAKSEIKLAPLGKHLMLMGVKQRLADGNIIEIAFSCGPTNQTSVPFSVRKTAK